MSLICALNIEDEGPTSADESSTIGEKSQKSGATNHCREKEVIENSWVVILMVF